MGQAVGFKVWGFSFSFEWNGLRTRMVPVPATSIVTPGLHGTLARLASKVLGKTKLRVPCLSQLLDPVMLQGLRAEEKEKGSG